MTRDGGPAANTRARPRVAVCIVTYNHARYIADCLLSVLSQDVEADVSVWVGNDMSTDGTSAIVDDIARRWPERVHHVVHATRQGPIGNTLSLVAMAQGDYIAHLDGDDLWLPGKLREQLALLDASPRSTGCCTNAFVFDDEREPVGVFSNARSQLLGVADLLRRGNFLNHSSLLYRAVYRERLLALRPPFIDYRIHLLLASEGPLVYTSKPLVGYRANASGSMLVRDNEAVRAQYFEAIDAVLSSVDADVRADACADMVRRVFFRAVRLRRVNLLGQWWRVLAEKSAEGRIRFFFRCFFSVLGEAARQLLQALTSVLLGTRLRVLYFH
jgi:glycosyltransferase involved in cell wall biosynthesis